MVTPRRPGRRRETRPVNEDLFGAMARVRTRRTVSWPSFGGYEAESRKMLDLRLAREGLSAIQDGQPPAQVPTAQVPTAQVPTGQGRGGPTIEPTQLEPTDEPSLRSLQALQPTTPSDDILGRLLEFGPVRTGFDVLGKLDTLFTGVGTVALGLGEATIGGGGGLFGTRGPVTEAFKEGVVSDRESLLGLEGGWEAAQEVELPSTTVSLPWEVKGPEWLTGERSLKDIQVGVRGAAELVGGIPLDMLTGFGLGRGLRGVREVGRRGVARARGAPAAVAEEAITPPSTVLPEGGLREKLREVGVSDADIDKMTPQQAMDELLKRQGAVLPVRLRERLLKEGFSEADIDEMTPQQAWGRFYERTRRGDAEKIVREELREVGIPADRIDKMPLRQAWDELYERWGVADARLRDLAGEVFPASALDPVVTGARTAADAAASIKRILGDEPKVKPDSRWKKAPDTPEAARKRLGDTDKLIDRWQKRLDAFKNPNAKGAQALRNRIEEAENYKTWLDELAEELEAPLAGPSQPPPVARAAGDTKYKDTVHTETDQGWTIESAVDDHIAKMERGDVTPLSPDQQQFFTNNIKNIEAEFNLRRGTTTPVPTTRAAADELLELEADLDVPIATVNPVGENFLGFRPIVPTGLTKRQQIENVVRGILGRAFGRGVPAHEVVEAATREKKRMGPIIESRANVFGASAGEALQRVFSLDKNGGIPDLIGIIPGLRGAPTIQDVAARLPLFAERLTAEQTDALMKVVNEVRRYREQLQAQGIEILTRADIMPGGYYLPRGRAAIEGADLPRQVSAGIGRRGRMGFEKPAVFDSMAEGIAKNFEYAPIGEALESFAKDAGFRSLDSHITNYFKTVRNAAGELLGETPKVRLLRQNPALKIRVDQLRADVRRLKNLRIALGDRLDKAVMEFLDDPLMDNIEELRELFTIKVTKGPSAGASAAQVSDAIRDARSTLRALMDTGEWQHALKRARVAPHGQRAIGMTGLAGRTFADEIAEAANKVLIDEMPLTGSKAIAMNVAEAVNTFFRGMKATADNSGMGIQGLLGFWDDNKAWRKAARTSFYAWGRDGERVLGAFINEFDGKAAAAGRLLSDQWAQHGIRIGGAATEFQVGQGVLRAVQNLPVIRQANRAFGYFGDSMRLGWADDMLRDELRLGKRSLDEIAASGDLEEIARIANNMTGWTEGRAFGSMGDLIWFAPRFLQARLETVTKAAMSLKGGATLEQRIARRSILKMVSYGTATTFALNYMLGNETDMKPIKNGRYNSNFMRVRWGGRDWSLFGAWDFIPRLIIATAAGEPQTIIRQMGSGVVSLSWDLLAGTDAIGRPVREDALQASKWLVTSFVPIAMEEVPTAVGEIFGATRDEDILRMLGGGATLLGEMTGVKSSALTPYEELQEARRHSMEHLSASGHYDFRGPLGKYEDLNSAQKRIVNKNPNVVRQQEVTAESQRERNSDYQAYRDTRDAIRSTTDDSVLGVARSNTPSDFREKRDELRQTSAIRLRQLMDDNVETLSFFEDVIPTTVFDVALSEYFEQTNDPDLDDDVMGYDFEERERRLKALRVRHGDELINSVESFIHEKELPIEKELREARKILRPFWDEPKRILLGHLTRRDAESAALWQQYLDAPLLERRRMVVANPAIGELNNQVSRIRKEMRGIDLAADILMVKWYGREPHDSNKSDQQMRVAMREKLSPAVRS